MIIAIGRTYDDLIELSAAEAAVLRALALASKARHSSVRLSSRTTADPKRPWAFAVHSRTASRLEERGLVETFLDGSIFDAGADVKAFLTGKGRRVVARITKRENA